MAIYTFTTWRQHACISHLCMSIFKRISKFKAWRDDDIPQRIGKSHKCVIIYNPKQPIGRIIGSVIVIEDLKEKLTFVVKTFNCARTICNETNTRNSICISEGECAINNSIALGVYIPIKPISFSNKKSVICILAVCK